MLKIQKKLLVQIQRHGEKAFPEECVGVLLGRHEAEQREVVSVLPLENSAVSKGTEFSVSLKELQRAEQSALLQNLDVIGFYHSHANFKAAASQKDKSFAIPDFSYPIVSVFNGKAIDVKSFSYSSNTGSGDKKENLTEEVIVCL